MGSAYSSTSGDVKDIKNDYELAIAEGATIVRVGTAIFGQRDYSKQ